MKLPNCIANDMAKLPEDVVFPPLQWQTYSIPETTQAITSVVFKTTPQRPLLLDLFIPKKTPAKPLPLVVYIHGGAWVFGDKSVCPSVPLTTEGFAAASISYRYSSEAVFPAQIEDCKAAIRWLRAHAEEYHLDPDRIGVWGHSAGGHLCALLGTTGNRDDLNGPDAENLEFSSAVQAVCNMSGPIDFLPVRDYDPVKYPVMVECTEWLIGGPVKGNDEALRRVSPLYYITGSEPPFLTIHGKEDPLVICSEHALPLHEALTRKGVSSTLMALEGEDHGLGSVKAETVFDFFRKVLK